MTQVNLIATRSSQSGELTREHSKIIVSACRDNWNSLEGGCIACFSFISNPAQSLSVSACQYQTFLQLLGCISWIGLQNEYGTSQTAPEKNLNASTFVGRCSSHWTFQTWSFQWWLYIHCTIPLSLRHKLAHTHTYEYTHTQIHAYKQYTAAFWHEPATRSGRCHSNGPIRMKTMNSLSQKMFDCEECG